MEGRQRRSFTDDYKRQAVDLVASSGRSIGSVAKELGLRDSVLRRWVEQRGARREPTAAARRSTTQATLRTTDSRHDFPIAAKAMAIATQRPGAGLIHHSDRGVQYASAEYRKTMQSAGFRASMSRRADCYDNAPMTASGTSLWRGRTRSQTRYGGPPAPAPSRRRVLEQLPCGK
jgi:transposase-like protein